VSQKKSSDLFLFSDLIILKKIAILQNLKYTNRDKLNENKCIRVMFSFKMKYLSQISMHQFEPI